MIGASHYRIGGDRLASGAGYFVADVRVPGMLHVAVLRSRQTLKLRAVGLARRTQQSRWLFNPREVLFLATRPG